MKEIAEFIRVLGRCTSTEAELVAFRKVRDHILELEKVAGILAWALDPGDLDRMGCGCWVECKCGWTKIFDLAEKYKQPYDVYAKENLPDGS